MNALAAIAPSVAIPVLSNTVLNGTAALSGAALRSLKSINPELSRQMTLAELRSPDSQRRSQAVGVAGTFEMESLVPFVFVTIMMQDNPVVGRHSFENVQNLECRFHAAKFCRKGC